MKANIIRIVSAAAILGLALTGCSTASASSKPKVIVGLETGSKPLSFINENNEGDGYEVELVKLLDEKIPDYDISYELVEADATEIGIDTGKYAFIGGGLYATDSRKEKYLFPEQPESASVIKLFVNGDNTDIHSLDDLVGKKISPPAPNGGIYNLLTTYNEEHPDAQLEFGTREGKELVEVFQEISDGTYDALVIPDNLGGNDIIEQLGLNVKIADDAVKVNPTYFVFAKDQTDLLEKANKALAELKADGTLSELNVKWFGEDKLTYID